MTDVQRKELILFAILYFFNPLAFKFKWVFLLNFI